MINGQDWDDLFRHVCTVCNIIAMTKRIWEKSWEMVVVVVVRYKLPIFLQNVHSARKMQKSNPASCLKEFWRLKKEYNSISCWWSHPTCLHASPNGKSGTMRKIELFLLENFQQVPFPALYYSLFFWMSLFAPKSCTTVQSTIQTQSTAKPKPLAAGRNVKNVLMTDILIK